MARTCGWYIFLIFPVLCKPEDTFEMPNHRNGSAYAEGEGAKILNLINSIENWIVPVFRRALTVSNTSKPCGKSILQLITDTKKMKSWAWSMLDASAKLPAGILKGNLAFLGDYDECVDISVKNESATVLFEGKYCLLGLRSYDMLLDHLQKANGSSFYSDFAKMFANGVERLKRRTFYIGLCVPSICSTAEINYFVSAVTENFIVPKHINCETRTKKMTNTLQITILWIFALFGVMITIGTCLDIIIRHTSMKIKSSELTKLLIGFSFYSNIIRLFHTEDDRRTLSSLSGWRVLTAFWIVLVHTYFLPSKIHLLRYRRLGEIFEFTKELLFKVVSSATLAIDTFFVLTGMLFVYTTWKKVEKNEKWFVIAAHILLRTVSILLIEMLLIAIVFISPLFTSGPLADVANSEFYSTCKDNWWANFLFIQNFWPINEICLPHTWFIGALFQILLLTFWVIFPLYRKPKVGLAVIISFILMGCILTGFLTFKLNLPSYFDPTDDILDIDRFLDLIHIRPYTYISSYLVGCLLGYAVVTKQNLKIKPRIQIISWLAAMCGVLLVPHVSYLFRNDGNRGINIAYAALHRTVWSCSISWMLFACIKGYGGIIGNFLSWNGFIPIDRLSLLIYLMHPMVIGHYISISRVPMNLDHREQLLLYFGVVLSTMLGSSLINITFEQPMRFIGSYISNMCFNNQSTNIKHTKTAVSPINTPVNGIRITAIPEEFQTEDWKTKY